MKIYRLEHATEYYGAYCRSGAMIMRSWLNWDLYHPKHPNPYKDSKLKDKCEKSLKERYWESSVHYGFSTFAQFRAWFFNNKVLKEFQAAGYVVRRYEVPKVYSGNSQAVFESKYHKPENIAETYSWDKFLK